MAGMNASRSIGWSKSRPKVSCWRDGRQTTAPIGWLKFTEKTTSVRDDGQANLVYLLGQSNPSPRTNLLSPLGHTTPSKLSLKVVPKAQVPEVREAVTVRAAQHHGRQLPRHLARSNTGRENVRGVLRMDWGPRGCREQIRQRQRQRQ